MDSGVNMLCFTASYAVALALEVAGLWTRPRWRRLAVVLAALAGLAAHTWYLGQRAVLWASAPLSSPHDWYLAAAWALAVIYLALVLYQPKASTGVFLLPVMLALIAFAQAAPRDAIASFQAPRFWGMVHGVFLMLGTVAVLMGFVAGVMYLLQSYRLKQKLPADSKFRLPSLEWLERVNTRSLGAAAILVAVGFFTGVIARLATAGGAGVPWTDPVVLSLSGMMSWLVAAEAFRVAYPAARRGRKVAYLTLAAAAFLAFTLASFMRVDGVHRGRGEERVGRSAGKISDCGLRIADWLAGGGELSFASFSQHSSPWRRYCTCHQAPEGPSRVARGVSPWLAAALISEAPEGRHGCSELDVAPRGASCLLSVIEPGAHAPGYMTRPLRGQELHNPYRRSS
jgi:ABC-type uncharacterized transport system permease subunit